ncbi:hypothetical protein SAMN05444920_10165 [Nonomuraea solani]|uniref:Uncharacterized protein n=1 Tax=Nonomuraea solani TaxID=1144553 RepID=A0A1H5SYQ0_9ACTN|nr:hypothetical protein [Nonomuraea solani]SEF55742.1 hypothetical protein SAMN05444920_10165 [Nonomuraea solani]
MRTWFQPEETEEFEAAKDLLVRRCLTWAEEHGRPADGLVLATAVDARHESRDGRLAYWDDEQVRRFLLRYVPHHVVAPRDLLDAAPDILRTLLDYLDATGLRDPRGTTTPEAFAQAVAEYPSALDDPTRQGLAKFWAQKALDHDVDFTDPAAFERFRQDIEAGRIDYDQAVLDQLVEARFHGTGLDEERAFPQPPITLPPAADLTEAATQSQTVQHLITLATWAGTEGRPLTKTGNLPLAAARELSTVLGTGEEQFQARSAAELPRLTLLLAWAKKLRLTRTAKGRLFQVTKAAPLLRDPETLWQQAFEALPYLGRAVTGQPGSLLADAFDLILPDVLNTIYGMDDMPVIRLQETVWLACQEYFVLDDKEEHIRDVLRRETAEDLTRTLEVLSDLGAIDLFHGPADPLYSSDLDHEDQELPPDAIKRLRKGLTAPDLPQIRLTPLGRRAVRDHLLSEGRDAPLLGALATTPPSGLLGVISQHYAPEDITTELNGWLTHPGQTVETLLQAIRDCPFRSRTAALLNLLTEALPQGRTLLTDLRHDPTLGPAVLTFLVDEGELDPESLSEREHLLLGAENFLSLLEVGGPEVLIEQLRGMAGGDAYEFVEAVLASGHHDAVGLQELRVLVAEPLRATSRHPLRLIPTTPPGAKGRRKKRKR